MLPFGPEAVLTGEPCHHCHLHRRHALVPLPGILPRPIPRCTPLGKFAMQARARALANLAADISRTRPARPPCI